MQNIPHVKEFIMYMYFVHFKAFITVVHLVEVLNP